MHTVNQTHDASLKSWIQSANDPGTDFPIQNLPFCVFHHSSDGATIGVGIGDQILNLKRAAGLGLLSDNFVETVSQPTLNSLMGVASSDQSRLCAAISELLSESTNSDREALEKSLVSQSDVSFVLPCTIGDYTDFYASVFHATNVGSMFRPGQPVAAQLQIHPDRLSRTSLQRRRQRHRIPAAHRATVPGRRRTARQRDLPANCWTTNWKWAASWLKETQLGKTISISQAEDHLFGLTLA